jgi:molecular chaperone HtpG
MPTLPSEAERQADSARQLDAFKDFSLPGVRAHITTLLDMIGRGGLFTTYSLHDITHIDAMLDMLTWLLPDQTKAIMTPADWIDASTKPSWDGSMGSAPLNTGAIF